MNTDMSIFPAQAAKTHFFVKRLPGTDLGLLAGIIHDAIDYAGFENIKAESVDDMKIVVAHDPVFFNTLEEVHAYLVGIKIRIEKRISQKKQLRKNVDFDGLTFCVVPCYEQNGNLSKVAS